jgi:hypothetical protein
VDRTEKWSDSSGQVRVLIQSKIDPKQRIRSNIEVRNLGPRVYLSSCICLTKEAVV